MQYREAAEYAAKLRELADFIETNGVKLPGYPSVTTQVSCWLTATDYVKDSEGEWTTLINEEQTKQNIKKFLDAVGSCHKEYSDDRLVLEKKYKRQSEGYGSTMIKGTVDRSVACKKIVTGQKFVQAQLIPAKIVDEYEWKCDEGLSLLKLVNE